MREDNIRDDFSKIQIGDILFSGWDKGSILAIDWVTDVDEDTYFAKVLQMWYSKWWMIPPITEQRISKDEQPEDLLLRHATEQDLRMTLRVIFKSDTDFSDEQ